MFEIFDSWLRSELTLDFHEGIDRIGWKEIKLLDPPLARDLRGEGDEGRIGATLP